MDTFIYFIVTLFQTMTVHKDGQHDSTPKVKPKHINRPLVACCSKGQKCVINMLVVGTWAKLKYQSTYQIHFSQRWFLLF